MLHREHDLFHGDLAFEEDESTRREQDQTRHQTQHKMALIGIFASSLASLGG
jgi:hypothetical protein